MLGDRSECADAREATHDIEFVPTMKSAHCIYYTL